MHNAKSLKKSSTSMWKIDEMLQFKPKNHENYKHKNDGREGHHLCNLGQCTRSWLESMTPPGKFTIVASRLPMRGTDSTS